MKTKTFFWVLSVLFCLVGMSSCSEDELVSSADSDDSDFYEPTLKVNLNAIQSEASRVNFETGEVNKDTQSRHSVSPLGKVSWVDGDKLLVTVIPTEGKDDTNTPTNREYKAAATIFVYNESTGVFTQDPAAATRLKLKKGISYYWSVVNFGLDTQELTYTRDGEGKLNSLTTPAFEFGEVTQSVKNPMAHLAAIDFMYGNVITPEDNLNPSLNMKHLGALMKFTVSNNTSSAFNLKSFNFNSYSNDAEINSRSELKFNPTQDYFNEYIRLSIPGTKIRVDGDCMLGVGESYDLYTIVHPFDLPTRKRFITFIETDKGIDKQEHEYYKQFRFDRGSFNTGSFKAKRVYFPSSFNIEIPDLCFRNYLIENFDQYNDGNLQPSDADKITSLNLTNMSIRSLKGIERMPNLESLTASSNPISKIDLSKNTKLKNLVLENNLLLDSLNLTANEELTNLTVNRSGFNWIDCSGLTKLTNIEATTCSNLATIKASDCSSLQSLSCDNGKVSEMLVNGCTQLKSIDCTSNRLASIDVTGLSQLDELFCRENALTELNLKGCSQLTHLNCSSNKLSSIGVSQLPLLRRLYCDKNQLTSLDFSHNPKMENLVCSENELTELNINGCNGFTLIYCGHNQLTALDIQQCPNIYSLMCYDNQLTSLDLSNLPNLAKLNCSYNELTSLNLHGSTKINWMYCGNNQLTTLDISDCCLNLGKTSRAPFDAKNISTLQTIYVSEGFFDVERPYCVPSIKENPSLYKVKK